MEYSAHGKRENTSPAVPAFAAFSISNAALLTPAYSEWLSPCAIRRDAQL
jgi:hypothetical protein